MQVPQAKFHPTCNFDTKDKTLDDGCPKRFATIASRWIMHCVSMFGTFSLIRATVRVFVSHWRGTISTFSHTSLTRQFRLWKNHEVRWKMSIPVVLRCIWWQNMKSSVISPHKQYRT